jgi:inner membrane protein
MTHAAVGVAVAQALAPCRLRASWSWLAAGAAMLPDADVIGFGLGIRYGDMWGHRGITHSLLFGFLLAGCVSAWFWNRIGPGERIRIALCGFLAAVSHGVLDAFTNGGLGVAFFAPFAEQRYFFPVTPIPVSPIGAGFFSARGADVFAAELVWVWCPALAVILAARLLRCRPAPGESRYVRGED